MRPLRAAGLCLLLVFVLIAAGCADRTDTDRDNGGGGVAQGSDDGTADGEGETFGTLDSPCGAQDPDTAEPTSTDPADAQGVEDGSVSLGTIADPGFDGRPGLNQELFDAGQAFVAWCNEQGGINGRQIQLTEYDAAVSQYQQRLTEACSQELAMVGGGAVTDNLWATTGRECGLVDVAGFAVTPEKAGVSGPGEVQASRTLQPIPNPSDEFAVGMQRLMGEQLPDSRPHAAILYGDLQTLSTQRDRQVQAMEQIGFELVQQTSYNVLGEASWAPFASSLRDDGVEYLTYVGEGSKMASIQLALEELGYEPEVTQVEGNLYDPEYLDAAGDAADGTFVRLAIWPFEEAAENEATQEYIDLVEARDGKVAALGAQSFSAWLLFAQLASACDVDGDLTRSCILERGAEVHEWTGGGLHAPADPGNNATPACFIALQVEDGEFVRYEPSTVDEGEGGYDCSDDNVAELEGSFSSE